MNIYECKNCKGDASRLTQPGKVKSNNRRSNYEKSRFTIIGDAYRKRCAYSLFGTYYTPFFPIQTIIFEKLT
ncbi:hypothetical protein J32TS6_36750 [Virgibacillus pantothenticus]|uniref:hypothetical protein n=1 Tax=Virgibacillus pantothenticus TaxID=1473 RepID=UPI001B0A3D20|nr:hypothetical protein [Virgibacillus pantothenticus]MBU8568833.1 hypothetical protein [Virgibacillus pantothenticus]GIP65120.1 hypothetical protein J32TS6_36750 [Virgibacillus pantothenticus]